MYLRHLSLIILVKLNLWHFFDKMQTFFAETFFADIAIIHDIEVEGIQMIVQVFHYKIHLTSSVLLITLEIIILHTDREC